MAKTSKGMNTLELKSETTLACATSNTDPHAKLNIFAVIVDMTEPIKFEAGNNFMVRLKIIDPSFNYRAPIENRNVRFFKFCHVNIYSETPEAGPQVQCIGDIIRLRRFNFAISERGELMAYEQTTYSNWMIYSGVKGASYDLLSYKRTIDKNIGRQVTPYESGRINDLRVWAYDFFSGSSMRYIIWWNDLNATSGTAKKDSIDHENVDLILKVTGVVKGERRINFVDSEDNKYTVVMAGDVHVREGQVVKMRCVNVRVPKPKKSDKSPKPEVRQMTLNERSSCLYLRDYFRDALSFDPEVRKHVGKNLYLLEYSNEKKSNFVTDIKKLHSGLKRTPAAALLQLLGREPALHQNEKFIFEGRIASFVSVEPKDVIRKQVDKSESTVALNAKADRKYQVIYHVVMQLQDDSSKEPLTAYLTTSSDSYYVFEAWGLLPPTKDNAAWDAIKPAELTKFSNKLASLAKTNQRVRFVLQLLLTSGEQPFFKVIDTLFRNF